MITDDLLADARQPDGSYQFAESFAAVSGYTLSADLAIGNLECNFCGEPYAGKPDLPRAGFTCHDAVDHRL